ncbi:response regulator [Desulfobacter hydrogenophilus]|uniref:Response regulator n=1 Tax=Desulfobacter hydrogenophilus TaxID=2291 RepID=A0A328FJE5_9BACT|nr:HDOD domain-containing protein [Desulfobacter hydrogenophilus]NDY72732.1 response regulator [Desulfobacter hydrogenophilus]QBH12569.1 response regulator [Desulfobacter hydrogenophilus]RAM03303.1 response regulator [Desulfobacter hydrogenophilus]
MKILIVDDENISRNILLSKMTHMGTCVAVTNAKEALAELDKAKAENQPFNVITLDVSMPGMGGQELLELIRKKEDQNKIPKKDRVKIIMITARMNLGTINACIRRGCNGYLTKPVSQVQLIQSLSQMGFEPATAEKNNEESMSHSAGVGEIIKRFYSGKIILPVFPSIVKEIEELLAGKDPSVDDLAKIVEKDLVISSKLITIANSSLYKGLDDVNSLNGALVRLGLKHTLTVCSALATRNLFDSDDQALKTEMDKLWIHSFAVATLARRLAEEKGIDNLETIYLMGLVHDIGKMLLMKVFGDMYPDVCITNEDLQRAIHEIHTTFGGVLLKKMHFSKQIIKIAEFHHWDQFEENTEKELLVVSLADSLARELGFLFFYNKNENNTPEFEEGDLALETNDEFELDHDQVIKDLSGLSALKILGLDPEKVFSIIEQIHPMIKETSRAF